MNYQEYQPLEDRVLIKPIKNTEPEKTESGIITEMAKKETAEGMVVASGEGFVARDTGVLVGNVLKKGDVVLYGLNAGMPLDIPREGGGKDECRLMREGDVLALIKKS